MTTFVRGGLLVCLLLGWCTAAATAQDSPSPNLPDRAAATRPASSDDHPSSALEDDSFSSMPRRMSPPVENTRLSDAPPAGSAYAPFRTLIPTLSGTTITWIAVVLILALLLQTRPFLSWLNLDALMLALAALALAFRSQTASCPPDGPTLQFWSYAVLTGICIYWLWRGVQLTFWRALPARSANVSEGAMLVLIVAVLAIGFNTIANTPLSEGARDGLAGGIYMAETGKLPYGDLPGRDTRAPLLYALHAGAVKIVPPTGSSGPVSWSNRSDWLDGDRLSAIDPLAPRLVNGLLFVLLITGVGLIGQRLHSVAMGWTLIALFVIFPGTLECLAQSDVLLPAALLTWSVAFLTVPGVGPFLATLSIVFAGLAWPWAWLALPVMFVFFIRRGWQALAVVAAVLIGATAVGAMLLFMVRPTLPRADGALAAAGLEPRFTASLGSNGALVIEKYKSIASPSSDFKAWLWKMLLQAESTSVGPGFDLPPSTDASSVLYRELSATAAARERVQSSYRDAVAAWPDTTRLVVSLRSLLESVWRPDIARAPVLPSPWSLWFGAGSDAEANRVLAQRIAKGIAGALVVLMCWRIARAPVPELHQVLGALLAVSAAAMLASERGAIANWVWLMPLVLAVLAAPVDSALTPRQTVMPRGSPPPQPTRPSNPAMFASRAAEPRISVER
jgi:hypothetical protein